MAEKGGPPQSIACNAALLRQFREQLGWTQAELAERAGFSERLIVKAEGGRPISHSSIAQLAAALSSTERQVHADDLTTDPVALAKKYIEAIYVHQANMMDAIRHFLAEDVVFRISGDPTVIPFAGEHRGLEAVDRCFHAFFSCLEVPKDHDHTPHYQYIAQGTDVVAWGNSYIHPIGRPMEHPMPVSNLMRFRQGKLYELQDNYDTQRGAEELRKNNPG